MEHLALELFLWLLLAFTIGWLIGNFMRAKSDEPNKDVQPTPFVPRASTPDNLERISDVGPVLRKKLNAHGVLHFAQIASWTEDDIDQFVTTQKLNFKKRIINNEWVRQARLLADGKEEEFTKLYGSGGLISKKTGTTISGSRTRKSG